MNYEFSASEDGRAGGVPGDSVAGRAVPGQISRRLMAWLAPAALLILSVAALYARTAGFTYLRLDDWGYTAHCPFVPGGLTWDNIAQAFARVTYGGIWMPLTYISYMADVTLFGGGWAVHHAVNAALHAINAVAVFFFLRRFLRLLAPGEDGRREAVAAFLAALVWAVHPQRAEAVAWIASRKEELWTLFTLVGLIAWSARKWWAGCICCILACLSKPTAVCFPLLAALVEFIALRNAAGGVRAALKALPRYIPMLAVALVTGLAAIGAQTHPEGMAEVAVLHVPFLARLYAALASLSFGLFQAVFPLEVHFDYMAPPPMMKAGLCVSLALLCAAAAFLYRRMGASARRTTLFCVLFFLIAWLPVSGLGGSFGESPMADRFLYMPMVAAALAAAAFLASRTAKWWRFAALAIAAAFAAASWPVVSSYRNDFSVFSRTLKFEPGHWRALQHIGSEYCARLGRMDEGIDMMRRSMRISPHDSTAEVLAYSLACRGKPEDAVEIQRLCARFIRAPQLDKRGMFAESLGIAASIMKRWDDAIYYLSASVAAPQRFYSDTEAKFRLAFVLNAAGRPRDARSILRPLTLSDDANIRRRAFSMLDSLK